MTRGEFEQNLSAMGAALKCIRCGSASIQLQDKRYHCSQCGYISLLTNADDAPIEKQKYSSLRSIANGFRVMAWIVAIAQVIFGLVGLGSGTALAVPVAIGFFVAAAVEWMILTAIGEAITLAIDIATDVHTIVESNTK
jgi:hypothetical protein